MHTSGVNMLPNPGDDRVLCVQSPWGQAARQLGYCGYPCSQARAGMAGETCQQWVRMWLTQVPCNLQLLLGWPKVK
jgi:hypothetical protein